MALKPRGNSSNFFTLYCQSADWEREAGSAYYPRQLERIARRGLNAPQVPIPALVGAFAAISPNASETSNYIALDACVGITTGALPPTAKVAAYPDNRAKALRILSGTPPEDVLGGNKVRAFYHNTLSSVNEEYLTIDGHMLGAWIGKRLILRREAQIKNTAEYNRICDDMRDVAHFLNIPAPHLQAILWLTWKRVNNVLYDPQLKLDWGQL